MAGVLRERLPRRAMRSLFIDVCEQEVITTDMYKKESVSGRPDGRLETLDLVRGVTLVSMILYHGMWDFLYLSERGASMEALRTWYEGAGGHLWQQSICRTFILLSGFCIPFSRHIFRRGLEVSAGGIAVSAVTVIALYEDRILFGVLTFLGAAMLATGALQRAFADSSSRPSGNSAAAVRASAAGLAVCLFLFHLTRWINLGYLRIGPRIRMDLPPGLYTFGSGTLWGYIMTGLGFTMKGFFSTDYFSFLPWIFLCWTGLFFHRLLAAAGQGSRTGRLFDSTFFHLCLPFFNLIGRHSLFVYLIHQPLLYLLTMIIF